MSKDMSESLIIQELKEKAHEKYSFYKLDDLIHIVSKLMNAYELENYGFVGRSNGYAVIGDNQKGPEQTKIVVLNTWLMNYIDLQLEYKSDEAIDLYGFGPRESRFKLNLPEDQSLDYIQDFADVLYAYREEHEIEELDFDELDDLIKKYLEISKEEIEARKNSKTTNKTMKK